MKTNGFIHRKTQKPSRCPCIRYGVTSSGDFIQPIYGGFKGTCVVTPISPPPSIVNAPNRASGGLSSVLIGDDPHLEPPLRATRSTVYGTPFIAEQEFDGRTT